MQYTRRNFLKVSSVGITGLFSASLFAVPKYPQKRKPNIIYIMADDLGYGDLSCYGASKIQTPNIDLLAEQGIRLTDAHSPSAVCTPTRYGVLTGRYCWRSRLKKEVFWCGYNYSLIEPGRKTIGNMMQKRGYKTAQIGKWHLGWEDKAPVDYSKGYLGRGPKDLGFNYSFVTAAAQNMFPLIFVENHKIMSKLKPIDFNVYDPTVREFPERYRKWHDSHAKGPAVVAEDWDSYRVDEIYTEKAINFIKKHINTNPDTPFYLHFTPEAPHRPNIMPEFMRGTSQAGWRGDHVQLVDWMVGQITGLLKKLKIEENTLIIVTSDNGPKAAGIDTPKTGKNKYFGHKSAGDLRGYKTSLWEGGHRVPFVARWPGKIKPGTENDVLVCLTDMMATFAAIVEYELDKNMGEDSFNALSVLLGEKREIRNSIVHHDYGGRFSIRKGSWKLVGNNLFNIEEDVQEKNNVAKKHPEIVEELKKLLQKQKDNGATSPHALQ